MPFDDDRFRIAAARLEDYRDCLTFLNERGQDLLRSGELEYRDALFQARLMDRTRTRISIIRERDTRQMVAVALLMVSYDWRKGVGSVEYVLVDTDFRGCGLGRVVMEDLLAQAREVRPRLSVIRLVSEPWHEAARALYQKLGFTLVDGSDRHFELRLQH